MQAQTGEAAGAAPGTPDRASVQKADPAIAARLAVALGGCSSDNELFRVAAEACHQLTGDVCHVSVAILSHKEDVLYFFKLSRELSGTHEHIGSLPLDWSAAGSAVQLKSAVCHGHIANSGRRYVDWQHFRATCGAVAVVSAPLIVADKVLGVLSIASKREDAFAGSLRGVEAVAAVVAPLVGLQRFRRELKSTENLLRRMLPAHTMDRLHELQAPLQHAQPANDFGEGRVRQPAQQMPPAPPSAVPPGPSAWGAQPFQPQPYPQQAQHSAGAASNAWGAQPHHHVQQHAQHAQHAQPSAGASQAQPGGQQQARSSQLHASPVVKRRCSVFTPLTVCPAAQSCSGTLASGVPAATNDSQPRAGFAAFFQPGAADRPGVQPFDRGSSREGVVHVNSSTASGSSGMSQQGSQASTSAGQRPHESAGAAAEHTRGPLCSHLHSGCDSSGATAQPSPAQRTHEHVRSWKALFQRGTARGGSAAEPIGRAVHSSTPGGSRPGTFRDPAECKPSHSGPALRLDPGKPTECQPLQSGQAPAVDELYIKQQCLESSPSPRWHPGMDVALVLVMLAGLLGLVWGADVSCSWWPPFVWLRAPDARRTMWSSMLRVIPAAFCVAALAALLLPVGMLLAGKHDVPGIRCLRTLLSMPRAAVDMFGTCLMRQARWTTVIGTALLLGALLLALQAKFGPVRGAVYGSVHLVNTLLIGVGVLSVLLAERSVRSQSPHPHPGLLKRECRYLGYASCTYFS